MDLIVVLIAAVGVGAMILLAVERSRVEENEAGDNDAESQPRMTKDDRVTVWDIATGTFLGGCLLIVASAVFVLLVSLLGFGRVMAWLRDVGFFVP